MDKYLVIWHEAFDGNDWFVLEADRNASDEALEELATAEIEKGYGGLEEEPEYYTDYIINITALCEEV